MEIPMSFQLPAYSLASISKLPFFGKLPIEAIGNIPIENKGIPCIAHSGSSATIQRKVNERITIHD